MWHLVWQVARHAQVARQVMCSTEESFSVACRPSDPFCTFGAPHWPRTLNWKNLYKLKHTCVYIYIYVPGSGSPPAHPTHGLWMVPPPLWCGWGGAGWGGVGRGGEVEYEVEGKSDKWWILAPDQ